LLQVPAGVRKLCCGCLIGVPDLLETLNLLNVTSASTADPVF